MGVLWRLTGGEAAELCRLSTCHLAVLGDLVQLCTQARSRCAEAGCGEARRPGLAYPLRLHVLPHLQRQMR